MRYAACKLNYIVFTTYQNQTTMNSNYLNLSTGNKLMWTSYHKNACANKHKRDCCHSCCCRIVVSNDNEVYLNGKKKFFRLISVKCTVHLFMAKWTGCNQLIPLVGHSLQVLNFFYRKFFFSAFFKNYLSCYSYQLKKLRFYKVLKSWKGS